METPSKRRPYFLKILLSGVMAVSSIPIQVGVSSTTSTYRPHGSLKNLTFFIAFSLYVLGSLICTVPSDKDLVSAICA